MEKDGKNKLEEPHAEYMPTGKAGLPTGDGGRYTYADYLSWQMEEMVELIKGKIFRQAAAPRVNHQRVSAIVFNSLFNFLKGKKCEAFSAPFDVRLPVKSKKHEDIDTVVQPDICVICDPNKLDELGCVGAPDLVVQILSPGNNSKELLNKYEVYEEAGVREYWVIQPNENTLLIYSLVNGRFVPSRLFTHGDIVRSDVIVGFSLDLEEVFRNV